MLSTVWQVGLKQLQSSSSAEAAAWLNKRLGTTAGLMTALYLGTASKGMTAEAALKHVDDAFYDAQQLRHFTEQQAREIAAEVAQPAVDAAAAAAAEGRGGLVQLGSLWKGAAFVTSMGYAAVSAPVLHAMLQLQLQLQLDHDPADVPTAAGESGGSLGTLAQWGVAVGAVLDRQQLQVTLDWLAASYNSKRLPAACATVFLGGAVLAAVQSDERAPQGSGRGSVICGRTIAAQGSDLDASVSSRVQFLAEALRAAQRIAEQLGGKLPGAEVAQGLIVFVQQQGSEVDLQQLLPAELCASLLRWLLMGCQDA
jgi:hypothetical protein